MKNYIKLFFVSVVAALVASCDPAESEYKYETYVDNIYTVNKATVQPEFSDTAYFVENMDKFGLKTGDRARMVLHFYHDAYSGLRPSWNISQLIEVIPTRELSAMDSTLLASYITPLDLDYYETSDRYLQPVWLWNNRQNINVKFKGVADGADFKLMVRGVSNDCVEFDLVAKVNSTNSVVNKKLLTFDLSQVGSLLSNEQKQQLAAKDSLRTMVYFKYENAKGEVSEKSFVGGKFKRTF